MEANIEEALVEVTMRESREENEECGGKEEDPSQNDGEGF